MSTARTHSDSYYIRQWIGAVLLAVLLHAVLYGVFMYRFAQRSDLLRNEQYLLQPSQPYRYLFAGDSHCQKAIDTAIVQQAAKWTGGGENNILRYYKIAHLLSQPQHPPFEYLLLSHDRTTYTTTTASYVRNYYYYGRFTDFAEWGRIRGNEWSWVAAAYPYRLMPYLEVRELYLRTAENVWWGKSALASPSLAQQQPMYNQQQADIFAQKMLPHYPQTALQDSVALVYLQKTLDLCLAHHIQPILVSYPMSQYLIRAFEQQIAAQNIDTTALNRLLQAYPTVAVWNYGHAFAQQDQLFADCQHLNMAGMRAFSQQIQADLAAAQWSLSLGVCSP